MMDTTQTDKILAVCDDIVVKPHQNKYYVQKIESTDNNKAFVYGKETGYYFSFGTTNKVEKGYHLYVTSRRQIKDGEWFIRNNEFYLHDESMGASNSNPIIATSNFLFGWTNVGQDEKGIPIGNCSKGNGMIIQPLYPKVPHAFLNEYILSEGKIHEVNVTFGRNIVESITKSY